MSADPTQFSKEMSVDHADECTATAPTHLSHIGHSSNSKCSKPVASTASCSDDLIQFINNPFAQSLIPYIHLLGITDNCIQTLTPIKSTKTWSNIGCIDKDIQDASYVLLDNNTKLLRCGGLWDDQYVSSVSICNLTQHMKPTQHRNGNDNKNAMRWLSLPRLNHRRHGHNALCINIFNKPHLIAIGGFDSKGQTINKSEILPLNHIQNHIQSSIQNKGHKQNGRNRKKNGYWNMLHSVELAIGIADFGVTYDGIHDRIYICGGLNDEFNSVSDCVMFDIRTDKWLAMPKLNYARHCNQAEILYNAQHHNPNVLMTFGGWSGNQRNSVEIIDFRNNCNKWQIHRNNNNKKKKGNGKGKGKGKGLGMFNYPHCATASVVKSYAIDKNMKNGIDLQQQLNGLNIKQSAHQKENVVIVCGHREGLFTETNYIEALEMRTRKWHTIARFKCAQNCNVNRNVLNSQQTPLPPNNGNIDKESHKKYNRFSHAFRYLTLL